MPVEIDQNSVLGTAGGTASRSARRLESYEAEHKVSALPACSARCVETPGSTPRMMANGGEAGRRDREAVTSARQAPSSARSAIEDFIGEKSLNPICIHLGAHLV